MKNYIKYLISAVVFFGVYILVNYLIDKNINWIMSITATIVYLIFNVVSVKFENKKYVNKK